MILLIMLPVLETISSVSRPMYMFEASWMKPQHPGSLQNLDAHPRLLGERQIFAGEVSRLCHSIVDLWMQMRWPEHGLCTLTLAPRLNRWSIHEAILLP